MRKKNIPSINLLLGTIFLIIGVSFLCVGVCVTIFQHNFKFDAKKVRAEIVSIESYYDSRHEDMRHNVTVSYEVDGQVIINELNEYSSSMKQGKIIDIYVDREDPYRIMSDSAGKILSLVFSLIGLPFAILGAVFLSLHAKKKKNKKRLLECGKRYQAVVTGGDFCYTYTINGRHPFKWECRYDDEMTGQSYLFSSDVTWEDPNMYIDRFVDVYADPQDMSKYYMDIDTVISRNNQVFDFRN